MIFLRAAFLVATSWEMVSGCGMLYAVIHTLSIADRAQETSRKFTDLGEHSMEGMSQWAQGFPLAHGEGSHRLAEVGEGVSEARPGEEAEEIQPCSDMVDFADETIRPKVGWSVGSVGRSFRQKGVKPYRGKVEISGAWGGRVKNREACRI